ncbi:hypothetical protein B0H10DRAFT_1833145, partial [Mycena sp. CBHHK59/15]
QGIIAIEAMSEISQIVGKAADYEKYGATTKNLTQSWINLAFSSGHLRWNYGDPSSFGLMYNLIGDRLLQLNSIPSSIYGNQSAFLSSSNITVLPFGLPLSCDSNLYARSDWTSFAAATAADSESRNSLISMVHVQASSNISEGIFPTVYNAQNGASLGAGKPPNGFARLVM